MHCPHTCGPRARGRARPGFRAGSRLAGWPAHARQRANRRRQGQQGLDAPACGSVAAARARRVKPARLRRQLRTAALAAASKQSGCVT